MRAINREEEIPMNSIFLIQLEPMKYIIIILLVILSSCKNITKTEKANENGIDNSVTEMWNNYIKSNSEFATNEMPEAESFHNNKEDADRLADLILKEKKKAGSSMYSLYEKYSVDLPEVGTKQIVTDFDGQAIAIIEIVKVDTIPFNQISTAYAELDMGTNIAPLEKWKKAHWNFFESFMTEDDDKLTEDMLIVCTWFETIWPTKE